MGTRTESKSVSEQAGYGPACQMRAAHPGPEILIVCEHASNAIPAALDGLGLPQEARESHIAWDPGALKVAEALHEELPSALIYGTISRLVYDCNRPPDAPSAIPARSEHYDIPGNQSLTGAMRQERIAQVFEPFTASLSGLITQHRKTLRLMITVHSFTPVYLGTRRAVELGVLHGQDAGFAEAMMDNLPPGNAHDIRLNAPYSARDGVTHTLDAHGAANGLQNVMLEIRSDLIGGAEAQLDMGAYLARWIERARLSLPHREGAA